MEEESEIENRMMDGEKPGSGMERGTSNAINGVDKIGVEKKEKIKNAKEKNQEQYRVVINKEANDQLDIYLKKSSEGNEPVEIYRSDLANYIFCNLGRFLQDSDFKTIRSQHFDDRRVLKEILKRGKSESELPMELKRALRDYYGITDKDKKRAAKQLQVPTS